MRIHLPLVFWLDPKEVISPIAIDLFAGCGGGTQGLKDAGFYVAGAVDSSELAVETFVHNHPEVVVWEDTIRNLSARRIRCFYSLEPGGLDLLAGCPPCQGFSSMRTLNGTRAVADERNDLVFDYLRFVEEFLPKVVMMENVPELADDHRMTIILARLGELGYCAEREQVLRVLDAADFGVAQRRKRMILLTGRHGPVGFPSPEPGRRTVEQEIGSDRLGLAGQSGDPLHDYPERRSERILEMISRIPLDGGSRTDLPERYWLECHKRCDGFKDVYGRMAWSNVAPTITGGCTNPSKGRFLHPDENRAITLREAALLQSFPSNYYFSLSRGKSGASGMIGNAVPPRLIEKIAERILVYLGEEEAC